MRNGAPAYITFSWSTLKPVALDQDPAAFDIKVKDPTGAVVETAAWPGDATKDSTGHFHWQSQPMDYAQGGMYTVLAKAAGYPEIRLEVPVEPSAW